MFLLVCSKLILVENVICLQWYGIIYSIYLSHLLKVGICFTLKLLVSSNAFNKRNKEEDLEP